MVPKIAVSPALMRCLLFVAASTSSRNEANQMNVFHHTWRFGALRQVVINSDSSAWRSLDYLARMPRVVALVEGRTMRIIGEADRMTALVQLGDEPTVYALLTLDSANLFPVAANVQTLVATLDDLASLWHGRERSYTLDSSADNIELAQIMLDAFDASNPGCDVGFWEYHCLSGLNMGFPLE
jgi:hypothetical protein